MVDGFKKLQQKWEMLSGREPSQSPPSSPTNTANKSKIPRPITSPVKPSGIPVLISPSGKQNGKLSKKNVTPSATKSIAGAKTKPAPLKKQTSAARYVWYL
jgi:hypothetical protein